MTRTKPRTARGTRRGRGPRKDHTMPHPPGCGCPGPAEGPCPLDPTPADQQRQPSTKDLVHAALAGEIQPEQQQASAGRPLALNDDDGLRAVILSALGAKNTNNQQ